jgi:hypothetical protein
MEVVFERTGERRYAVVVAVPGEGVFSLSPAPGYDDHIPHDLVHYVVEAELGLTSGVFGRAAKGGGSFIARSERDAGPRERARKRRQRQRRESSLRRSDDPEVGDMAVSERLAAACDLAFRRRHGQRPDPTRPAPPATASAEDAARIDRVVARLGQLAPVWNALPVGGRMVFSWPGLQPVR